MGGPYWAAKDEGAWSIPKGEYDGGETAWETARREFAEEIGRPLPEGTAPLELGEITQRGGKVVTAFAVEGDLDPETASSNTFQLEWPPRSGQMRSFPEVDRVAWFAPEVAAGKALAGQAELFERLAARLAGG
jgi:predicted NUDIX family NTP pyrophosphohydrolase